MSLVQVTPNGELILPPEIRHYLNLMPGDRVRLSETVDGNVLLSNASEHALAKAQAAFAGVADKLNVSDEEDVQKLVDEVRDRRAR